MTDTEIRERMNRMSTNIAKLLAVDMSAYSSIQSQVAADAIAVFTQLAIDIHKIAERRP